MGKHKRSAARALGFLVAQGADVAAVVAPEADAGSADSQRLDLVAEEAAAASHGRPLGPAGFAGPYGVFGPDGGLIGVYEDDGPRARPQVILAG